MNWYIAKIVYQIVCGDGDHTAQFDEQIRLIHAHSILHAFYKARKIGKHEEDNFLNHLNKPVQWKFIDVAEVLPLGLADGAEIYSKISEEDDAKGYIRSIHLRAASLCENNAYELSNLN
jgi:hypothetical protein